MYLTVQQVRDRSRSQIIQDDDEFTDDDLTAYILEFEEIAEDYCGVAFIEREAEETYELCSDSVLILQPKIITITTFELEGDTFTGYDTPNAVDAATGVLRLTYRTSGAVEIAYTHGYATTPKMIERACVQYVRACALRDQSDTARDVLSEGYGDGGQTRYSTPDKSKGRPTGYLEVDRLLNSAPMFTVPGVA